MFPVLWSVVVLAAIGQAVEEESTAANQASLDRMLADLSRFELTAADPPVTLPQLRAPALRWNYPNRNVDDAAAFVWLSKDRPELIATLMTYRDSRQNPRRAYEFLSLSQHRLNAMHDGNRWWHPDQSGL